MEYCLLHIWAFYVLHYFPMLLSHSSLCLFLLTLLLSSIICLINALLLVTDSDKRIVMTSCKSSTITETPAKCVSVPNSNETVLMSMKPVVNHDHCDI